MENSFLILIFQLAVLIFSVMIHEISHGYVAENLGDPTARNEGRLTLNPLKHLDPFGSVILPLILSIPIFFGQPSIIFGWAKPVPYNPAYLKNPKSGAAKIAAAGPISNLVLAAIFGILIRFFPHMNYAGADTIALFFGFIVYINILLAIFNLMPIPPLDGSKVLFSLLPPTESSARLVFFLERYGLILLLMFIFFGFGLIIPLVDFIYRIFAGPTSLF
ncbi:MAG: site-2 protease family protein [Candidatus Liptonbacteria bacterium]|nr:site-2 protease family protein [Candidatus Liptonbacteria bacterium]